MHPRIEQKLAVPACDYISLIQWLSQRGASLLFPPRQVSSTYFDTSQQQMLSDTIEGIVPRRKVRIRCYGLHGPRCESSHQVETKLTTEHGRKKKTEGVDAYRHAEESGLRDDQYGWISPVVHVTYEREYFSVSGIRMTLDRNIRYRTWNTHLKSWCHEDQIAVELKAPPETSLDWLMNEFPFPRIHFSKYERAMLQISVHVSPS